MTDFSSDNALLKARHRAEKRFRFYGIAGIALACLVLLFLLGTIVVKGYSGFYQTRLELEVFFDPAVIDPDGTRDPRALAGANYSKLARESLKARFPEVSGRREKRELYQLLSEGAATELRQLVLGKPSLVGKARPVWLTASSDVDMFVKGNIDAGAPEAQRRLSDRQLVWIHALQQEEAVATTFNQRFFTEGDSREPELAGMYASIIGSLLVILVCLGVAFPLGVLTAVYLEEFAPKNRFVTLIEVNINNLASVPSIIFGLLGLAVFLQFFELPRSAPLVGGLTLSLMILPTLIITTRAAIQAVPPSIRDAARGLGASPLQVVMHHVLPLAMPGVMTGTILGTARALGETAPLLMIGMVAFIADVPGGFTDPATAMPVQVYLWADSPEAGFAEKTAAAIIVLLAILMLLNALAIWLRKKFEHRWD